jgi:hypothetical protein
MPSRGTQPDRVVAPALVQGRRIDPESGMPVTPERSTDRSTDRLGRPNHWSQPDNIRGGIGVDRIGRADAHREPAREERSSVARIEPEAAAQARGGSTVGHVRLGALARVLRPHRWLPRGTSRSTRAGCS